MRFLLIFHTFVCFLLRVVRFLNVYLLSQRYLVNVYRESDWLSVTFRFFHSNSLNRALETFVVSLRKSIARNLVERFMFFLQLYDLFLAVLIVLLKNQFLVEITPTHDNGLLYLFVK